MEDTDITRHIKQILEDKGWSNYRLAKKSGIPKETLNKMLRDNTTPSIRSLIKICKGLGISVSQFMAEIEFPKHKLVELNKICSQLSETDKQLVKAYVCGLLHRLPKEILEFGSEKNDI